MNTTLHEKQLIVSLIKDDLINSRLVSGLNRIGLDAEHYFLHLSETVFKLIGFKDNERTDEVYQCYLELSKKAETIDISKSHVLMEALALEIYRELLLKKTIK